MDELKRIGVVLKRARYFITCNGKAPVRGTRAEVAAALLDPNAFGVGMRKISLDEFLPTALPGAAPLVHQLADGGMDAREAARITRQEALTCLTKRL